MAGIFSWFRRRTEEGPKRLVSEGARDCHRQIHARIEEHLSKTKSGACISWHYEPVSQSVMDLPPAHQVEVLHLLLDDLIPLEKLITEKKRELGNQFQYQTNHQCPWAKSSPLQSMVWHLSYSKVSPDHEAHYLLLQWLAEAEQVEHYRGSLIAQATEAAGVLGRDPAWLDRVRPSLEKILQHNAGRPEKDLRALEAKLVQVTGAAQRLPLDDSEVWSETVLLDLDQMEPDRRNAWRDIFFHAVTASGSKPSGKWLKKAEQLMGVLGADRFRESVQKWFPLVEKPLTKQGPQQWIKPGTYHISDEHMDVLRGLVWMAALAGGEDDLIRALRALALTSYKKLPGTGARAVRVGNACIHALGSVRSVDALGQLALLKVKVKSGSAQAELEKALAASAEAMGLAREELEEMSVPAYGLEEVGQADIKLGEFVAELRVIDSRNVQLKWRKEGGKEQKSLPAQVKSDHAEDLKEIKQAKADIEKMLSAQVERLEGLFLRRKPWPFEVWAERYLNHPLVGTLARRLIWNFQNEGRVTPGVWLNEKLVDRLGNPLSLSPATEVSLWHPLDQSVDVVMGWRGWLEEWDIRQPFKQAHREVYILTPAEEQTGTYSNRFASHLLKQYPFNALCAARGWKNQLRMMVDAEYPPAAKRLPDWGLRAEFWVEGAGTNFGSDTSDSGAFLYLATDQVRFYRLEDAQSRSHAYGGGYTEGAAATPLALSEVTPLVFSEVMRDVDLFVGVASVGNDPAWTDGGRNAGQQEAWRHFAFGDLSAPAQTRKDILQKLVPKLKIAKQCSFVDKFLVVEGKRHSYKIHLGSGNILRSPNDRYLCIVASQGKAEDGNVFLPFEGDRTLSVILSKAFLLAQDDKITDSSILAQL